MSFRTIILILVGIDACLGGVLCHALLRTQTPTSTETAGLTAEVDEAGQGLGTGPVEGLMPAEDEGFTWQMLDPQDARRYVANLRKIECPEETLRNIVLGEVNRRFAIRERALKVRRSHFKPWESPSSHSLATLERNLAIRQLVREKRAMLADLLGYDLPIETPETAARPDEDKYEGAYRDLPEAKRQKVRMIQEAYWEELERLLARTLGHPEPEDLDELGRLTADRRVRLEGVLNRRELEDFELMTSPLADWARAGLAGLDATDDEVRAVFRAVQPSQQDALVEAETAAYGASRRNDSLAEVKARMEEQLKSALGEERHAELLRSRTPEFKRMLVVVDQLGLPRERASRAYELQMGALRELRRIQADGSLSADELRTAVNTLIADTEQSLLETLGPSGLSALKSSGPVLPGLSPGGAKLRKS